MKNFEIIANSSTFDKWSLDRLINGFLGNDGNLPAWAVGSLGNISLYFPHNGFGNLDIVADWRGGFVLTVYVFPFGKNAYKHLPKDYAVRSKALPVRVVEFSLTKLRTSTLRVMLMLSIRRLWRWFLAKSPSVRRKIRRDS